ncbi:Uncharacterised protein [Mycobacteroides abscessus subsp. abscessus]|nr:Uncharacterised protein [Mycobacteroides abscessus subsp. abscessus]
MASTDPGWTSRWPTSQAMRRVSTRVLPDPAPATTSTGDPAWMTASRCGVLSPANNSAGSGTTLVV